VKQHLEFGGREWCDDAQDHEGRLEDPRDATCSDCLRRAAAYGAAAAMRYAAVEAGATQDPELVRERDDAIKRVGSINEALKLRGMFFCNDCTLLHRIQDLGLEAGGALWCKACAPYGVHT
jgi:hypothetical protein